MRTYLSGMPECKLGLNDKLTAGSDSNKSRANRSGTSVELGNKHFNA